MGGFLQRLYAYVLEEEAGELSMMRDGMVSGPTPAQWTSPYEERSAVRWERHYFKSSVALLL